MTLCDNIVIIEPLPSAPGGEPSISTGTGHLLLEGKLGDEPVIVMMTPYTQGCKKLRDVEAPKCWTKYQRAL